MPLRYVPFIALLSIAVALPTNAAQEPPATQSAETTTQREDYVRRRVLRDFQDEILAAKSALTELRDASDKHAKNLNDLLSNDAGKRLARDPVAVMTYVQIRDEPPPPANDITQKLKMVEEVQKSVDTKLARPFIEDLPAAQIRRDVLDAYAWARGRSDRLANRRDSLSALLADSPKQGDISKASTLEQAIAEYKNRYTRFLNEGWQKGEAEAAGRAQQTMSEAGEKAALERANQKARLELEKANAEIARMKAEHEAELRRLREEQAQKIADLDRALEVARAARLKQEAETTVIAKKGEEDAEKILLRKKCEDPETKRLLAPFLAAGYTQPDGTTTLDKMPVSYSKLQAIGALKETPEGLAIFITTAKQEDVSRPRWGYEADIPWLAAREPKTLEIVRRAQKLMIELGDTMVELKMLAP